MSQSLVLPVLLVIDSDQTSLDLLLSGLRRRFGNDFTVQGETSPEAALAALEAMADAEQPVALLLVDDAAGSGFLVRAHDLHPGPSASCWSIATTRRPAPPCRRSRWGVPTSTSCGRGPMTR